MFSLGSGRTGTEFRLEQAPAIRRQYGEWLDILVNAVRDKRDGSARSFATAQAAEDLFLDLYVPQVRAWQDANDTPDEWPTEDSRRRMKEALERSIASLLGIHPADVFTSALSFTREPTQG